MTKTALITGASRGLGHAMALALAPTHHIIAVGKTVGALEELDDAIKAAGGAATLAPMDITTDAAMQQLCRGIFDRWGHLDLWVHAAVHAAPLSPAAHIAPKDLTKSVDINVTATQRLIAYVAPLLGLDGQAMFFDDPRGGENFVWGLRCDQVCANRPRPQLAGGNGQDRPPRAHRHTGTHAHRDPCPFLPR